MLSSRLAFCGQMQGLIRQLNACRCYSAAQALPQRRRARRKPSTTTSDIPVPPERDEWSIVDENADEDDTQGGTKLPNPIDDEVRPH